MKKKIIIALIAVFSLAAIIFITVKPKHEKYTSVIIDCSDMGLTRAMSPKVLDNGGKEIYPGAAGSEMNMKEIVENGIVTYEDSLEKARIHSMAGENPLIIKAKSIEGIIKSDPVIDNNDAVKLSNADNETKFLSQRKVILVQ